MRRKQSITEITAEVWKEAAKQLAVTMVPGAEIILRAIEKSSDNVDIASSKGVDQLKEELSKQEMRLGFDLQQAKIAQELAIAHRITNAETVEIEEFYDRSGSGRAGLDIKEANVTFGMSGDGKSVVKRVYKFSGYGARLIPSASGEKADEK